jgi:aminoglycoside phosphotransferase (APT) family kinase protein
VLRRLPDLLAEAAAALHRFPVDGLHPELASQVRQPDVHDFLGRLAAQAAAIGRYDLERTAEHLAVTAPDTRVLCHGDLHPFNLLVDGEAWTLIDWSTAVVADPHYDLGFTTLMLANPPLGGPAPVRATTRAIGSRLARRFLHSYEQRTGRPVDRARLAWGRRAHALRALVEIATWEANGQLDAHRGHPWLMMRPVLEAQFSTACATIAPNQSTRPDGGST